MKMFPSPERRTWNRGRMPGLGFSFIGDCIPCLPVNEKGRKYLEYVNGSCLPKMPDSELISIQ